MSTSDPPGGESPYRGPPRGAPRDKRERALDASQRTRAPEPAVVPDAEEAPARLAQEQRLYGVNACLAMFQHRPQALRKVWLTQARMPQFKHVLAYCVQQRLGYTLVEAADLERLSGSAHHEGIVFGALAAEEVSLSTWLGTLPPGPQVALWLDGVGNPHNLGAILRSAAHFGAAGVLLSRESQLHLSGAAARVAEGGAESVPMVRLGRSDNALSQLQTARFSVAATVVRGGESLHGAKLPERVVLLMGAEQTGVAPALEKASTLRLVIPGTGAVESLNVASATSVLLSEWRRQHPSR